MADQDAKKESKVEAVKRGSRHLRGTIKETLAGEATHFDEADANLLKFHGSYQQDDRDQRRALRDSGQDKAYIFMVRLAIPGGVVTADQYLTLDGLADSHGNGSLRVTTRQGFQFHGVLKKNLKATIAAVNKAMLTTISACGDVERNVMACPAPLDDEPHRLLRETAREIAVQLRPASRAYYEIWLDEDEVVNTQEEEPFYGDTYLPRKFKTGIALDTDNCVDIYSYDCGLVAIVEGGRVAGYNVLVGGGMGMTHGKADTMARLASPLGFVSSEHAIETVRTVAAIFRDHGNRADRRHARLKYLINEWGMDRFAAEFRGRVSFALAPSRPLPPPAYHDHLGRHAQGDGRFFYGVFVENGRIVDRDGVQTKTALREIVEKHRPGMRLTPNQNVLLTDLSEAAIDDIERMLADHGVKLVSDLSAARRYSMACPALPTCGLAMSESERLMPSVVDAFEAELDSLGVRDVPITLRMTGCPNGCARPYTADIAFVGRKPDVYHVYVGGGLGGDRVADLYAADVPTDQLVPALRPLLKKWVRERSGDEGLSDFYQRLIGHAAPREHITGAEQPTVGSLSLTVLP